MIWGERVKRDGGFVCSPAGVLCVPIAVPWECVRCPTEVVRVVYGCVTCLCVYNGLMGSRSVG